MQLCYLFGYDFISYFLETGLLQNNNGFDCTSKKTISMHNKDKNNGNYVMGHNKYVMNASE